MNAWGKQSNSDGYEWDGNTFEDDEIALKESICGMTARFLLLHNVQDYERYTTQKEWSDAVIRLTGKTEMEAYRQEIESLWDEYYSFIRQTEQNEIDPEMDDFTREMEISFGCSDMMKKTEKVWAKLLVCEKPEGKENAPESLPVQPSLLKLTLGNDPVLREWKGGQYKCESLERFIKEYQKLSANLTPALIRDYLISNRTGEPYTNDTIDQRIKEHRT